MDNHKRKITWLGQKEKWGQILNAPWPACNGPGCPLITQPSNQVQRTLSRNTEHLAALQTGTIGWETTMDPSEGAQHKPKIEVSPPTVYLIHCQGKEAQQADQVELYLGVSECTPSYFPPSLNWTSC